MKKFNNFLKENKIYLDGGENNYKIFKNLDVLIYHLLLFLSL